MCGQTVAEPPPVDTPLLPASLNGQGRPLVHLQELGLCRDPEVFFALLLLLLLLPPLVSLLLLAALARPAPAAVAADEQQGEGHQQRQRQDDAQADGVEEALLVFGHKEVPDVTEEVVDFLHGAQPTAKSWARGHGL